MKILIIGTQPYNKNNQSRALKSYFGAFEPDELVQIFSDSRTPCRGFCSKLYQITDKNLILKRFKNVNDKIFQRENLAEEWSEEEINKKRFCPKRKTGFYRFLRKLVWKKRYWDTEELEKFVSDFNPQAIFLCWGEDFFLLDIAEHFARKLHVPLFLSITDDCYFLEGVDFKDGFDPCRKLYLRKYRKRVDALMEGNVIGIFESDKIKEKYTSFFDIPGEVIHIGSCIKPIFKDQNYDLSKGIYYFGNLEYGRFDAIKQFATCLSKQMPGVQVHIFSRDLSKEMLKKKCQSNLFFHQSVPYSNVLKLIDESGALLIAESFEEKYISLVRYSLSTKVGDSFCSMKPLICIGGVGAGAVDFVKEQHCAFVCDDPNKLDSFCEALKNDFSFRAEKMASKQFKVASTLFNEAHEALLFKDIVRKYLKVRTDD